MLTQRSRYGLRSMIFLATTPAGGPPVPMNRIAVEANVPRKFLELILADLRDAGLLHSHVEPSASGPPRRYYRITDSGRDCLRDWTAAWRATRDSVDSVLEGTHS